MCKQIVLDFHSKAGLMLPLTSGTQMWPHVKEIRTHRNPANNQSSESKFHWQIIRNPLPGVGVHSVKSRIQDGLGFFPYMGRRMNDDEDFFWAKRRKTDTNSFSFYPLFLFSLFVFVFSFQ